MGKLNNTDTTRCVNMGFLPCERLLVMSGSSSLLTVWLLCALITEWNAKAALTELRQQLLDRGANGRVHTGGPAQLFQGRPQYRLLKTKTWLRGAAFVPPDQ